MTGPAMNGFRRLPKKAAAAIIEFITIALAGNPYRLSKPLTSELTGLCTAQRGDHRVLFTLEAEEHVLSVHHRSDPCKPRSLSRSNSTQGDAGVPP